MRKVFLVHWHRREWEAHRETLRAAGWDVAGEHSDGSRAMKGLKVFDPEIVAISLDRLPSHGKQVAGSLQRTDTYKNLPVLYFASEDKLDRLEDLDGANGCALDDLVKTLEEISA